jgi:hypothetical protein
MSDKLNSSKHCRSMYRLADEGQFLPKNASISATELSFSVLNHFSNILRLLVPLSYVDEWCSRPHDRAHDQRSGRPITTRCE